MLTRSVTFASLLLVIAGTARSTAPPEPTPPKSLFTQLVGSYEEIRSVLIEDRLDGATDAARAMAKAAATAKDRDAGALGVAPEKLDEARELVARIERAARGMAEAEDIATVRDHFYAASKPLVLYRELVKGNRPVVVYCPMVRRSWLQPDEPVGNPYHGQSMLRCGTVVSR